MADAAARNGSISPLESGKAQKVTLEKYDLEILYNL